ncbi:MAG: START domain-containing protein [Pseudomonadota bacterium]
MAFLRIFSRSRPIGLGLAIFVACLWLGMGAVALAEDNVEARDGWRLQRQEPARQIRVYLHDRPGAQYRDVYAVTTMPGTTAGIESVLGDVAAMPQWAARVHAARLIKRQNNLAWIHIQYRLPYPFKPRDVVVRSERTLNGGVISIRSQAVRGYAREVPGKVRLYAVQSSWRLTPQPDGMVKIELWGSAEPGGLVPAVIYNYNLADDALQTLRQLRRMSVREKYQDKASSERAGP